MIYVWLMKLIKWGTGGEVPDQLFDLTNDPNETTNLVGHPDFVAIAATLETSLRSVVDFPSVANDVAQYGKDSMRWWMNATTAWESAIHAPGLRWTPSWNADASGSSHALQEWLDAPAKVVPCRHALQWPPKQRSNESPL